MAEQRTFRKLAPEQGWCCAHGCLSMEDLKAHALGKRGISPQFFVTRFDFEPETGKNILVAWRQGGYKCERLKRCMLAAAGLDDNDIPTISEETKKFRALRGKTLAVFRTEQFYMPEGVGFRRLDPQLRGVVVSLSSYNHLWIGIALPQADPEIKLGDQLFLDLPVWGTVIDIDGPNLVVLLPGPHHRLRNVQVFRDK